MSEDDKDTVEPAANAAKFEQAAERAAKARTGPVGEFTYFLQRTQKYWLLPVIVALLLPSVTPVAEPR